MWAAANDGRRRHQKRRSSVGVGVTSDYHEGDATLEKATSGSWSDSDDDSEASDERSTTESVNDEGTVSADKPGGNGQRLQRQQPSKKRKHSSRKRRKHKQLGEETPEAKIARLTSSYSAAMAAVGSLHRASLHVWKERDTLRRISENGGAADNMNVVGKSKDGDAAQEDAVAKQTAVANTGNPQEQLKDARSTIQRVAQAARAAIASYVHPYFYLSRVTSSNISQRKMEVVRTILL